MTLLTRQQLRDASIELCSELYRGAGFAYRAWRLYFAPDSMFLHTFGSPGEGRELFFRREWAKLQEQQMAPVDKTTKPAAPNMLPVKSSNIKELGFNPETGELRVRFASGGLFSYADVTQQVYDELRGAKSVGSYFARAIRPKFKATPL